MEVLFLRADLLRALHKRNINPEVDFISLASYHGGMTSSGEVKILRDITTDVANRSVMLVDDILETGRTLSYAKSLLEKRQAKRVYTCILLNKDCDRARLIEPDFQAFNCPDVFVVGYGMDLDNRLRELPFIGRIM